MAGSLFLLTPLPLNLVLHFMVGQHDAPVFSRLGIGEVASPAQSFNRMRRRPVSAVQMLEP